MDAINEAKAKEKSDYGIDLEKNPSADTSLVQLGQYATSLLPETMRKEQGLASSLWSNLPIDAGGATVGVIAAGLLATWL